MKKVALLLLLLLGTLATALAADAPGYHVLNRYRLGGEGGWDYLTFDGANHRLFIARATRVMVVDTDSGKLLGEIPNTPGVHGVALVYDLGRGFISNGGDGTVTVFDLKTLQPIGDKIKVGDNPDAILYDPASKRIFTFNGRSHDATALEAATGKVLGTIPLGGKPEFSATDGKGRVWVNIEDKSEVVQLDPAKLTVLNHWSLSPCEAPSGLALDEKNRRLVVGCDNKLMAIMNADTGKVVATLPVGEGVDAAGFDPGTGMAFTSNGGSGTLTVVRQDSPDKYTVVENVETAKSARTMTVDPKTHRVFTVAAQFKPPAPGQRRGSVLPDTFELIVLGPK
jgi:DNA-binding beta-propeller fold protein YncE